MVWTLVTPERAAAANRPVAPAILPRAACRSFAAERIFSSVASLNKARMISLVACWSGARPCSPSMSFYIEGVSSEAAREETLLMRFRFATTLSQYRTIFIMISS